MTIDRSVRHGRARRAALAGVAILGAVLALAPPASSGPIEDQRRRLPPAPPQGACSDPIEGVWRSQTFYPRQRQWYVFSLTVHRAGEGKLTGSIEVEGWNGTEANADRPKCFWTVSEPSAGTFSGNDIDFHGTSFKVNTPKCGPPPGAYVVDTFIGKLDPAIQEFQSVNRYPTGGKVVEDVTVFRRVSCGTAGTGATSVPTTPVPPAAPTGAAPASEPKPRALFGCNCGK